MKTAVQSRSSVELKDDVLAELKWAPSVRESQVGVTVKDGIVTLTGSVEFWASKSAAEEATQRVSGVKARSTHGGSASAVFQLCPSPTRAVASRR